MINRKVLLLNLPANGLVHRDVGCSYTSKSDYYYPQADLFMMGANVSKISELHYLDCIIENIKPDELLNRVKELCPDYIFTIISSITESYDRENLAKIKSNNPLVKIWATGDLIYYTEASYPEIDVQIKDFTNHADIIKAFNASDNIKRVIPVGNDREFSIGISEHKFGLNNRYHNPYSLFSPVAMILTNWGCPFRCTFCAARNLQGEEGKYKFRNDTEVLNEIKYAISLGFKEIYFRDFTFGLPRAEKLVDLIIESGLKFKWSCATRVDVVNEQLLRKMKTAGCYLIFYGVDAAEKDILKNIKKDLTLDEVVEKVSLTKQIGIETLCSFIVGFPNQDLKATKEFIFKLDPEFLAVSILSPTYGSKIRSQVDVWEKGVLDQNLNDSTYSDNLMLVDFRNKLERNFYFRPIKMFNYIIISFRGPRRLQNFIRSGIGLILKWVRSKAGTSKVIGTRLN